jgi:hypothetical protein
LNRPVGKILRPDPLQNPYQLIKDGPSVREAQGDDDDARVRRVQMPNRVEEVTVRCQKDRTEFLSFSKNRLIAVSLPASPPQIEHPMPHSLENPRGGFWRILVEEESHATASYSNSS